MKKTILFAMTMIAIISKQQQLIQVQRNSSRLESPPPFLLRLWNLTKTE